MVVGLWVDGSLRVVNHQARRSVPYTQALGRVLDFLDHWRSAAELATQFSIATSIAEALVEELHAIGFVEQSSGKSVDGDRRDAWRSWGAVTTACHFEAKNTHFPLDTVASEMAFKAVDLASPPPPITRRAGAEIELTSTLRTSVGDHLLKRRTWRRFGGNAISKEHLATLLSTTFRVQFEGRSPAGHPVPLKTAPSGGARHPIEAYVAVNGVEGVAAGLYHFDSWRNCLVRLHEGMSTALLREYVPSQPWFSDAQVVVLMTSVFGRTSFRYPSPRAYRNIFLEAGHLAQSFCLLATELGLAPFTTHALADSRVESDLSIDGIEEGVVYAVGCGTRPPEGWTPRIPNTNWEQE